MSEPKNQSFDFLPVIVLLAIIGVIGAGLWLFPYVQKIIQREDCVAEGREDC